MRLFLLFAILMVASSATYAAGGGKSLGDVEVSGYKSAPLHVDREQFAQGGVKKVATDVKADTSLCDTRRDAEKKDGNV